VTGLHVNHAFTLINGLLVAGLAWMLVQRGHTLGAGLVAAGPLLWWLDKAHAEVFLYVTIAVAALAVGRRPGLALVSAGLAGAQNPAGLVVLGATSIAVAGRGRLPGAVSPPEGPRDAAAWTTPAAVAVGLVVACSAPVYYLWHLGTWSPLMAAVAGQVPGLRSLLTPLVDLNLGLLWHAPILVALGVAGFCTAETGSRMLHALVTAAMLLVFAQVANVNHGGTPGMSRYALWLLAVWTPLVVRGADRLQRARPELVAFVVLVSMTLTWFLFRPSLADRAGASPNALASFVWSSFPSLDNPLPEVFAERLSGQDGQPPVPIATPGCEKVLTRGDGDDVNWPFPCEPRPAPRACAMPAALCYANGDAFVVLPAATFLAFGAPHPHAWTSNDRRGLEALLPLVGPGARHRRSTAALDRIASLDNTPWSYVVEGETGSLVWIQPGSGDATPVLRVRLPRPARIEVRDRSGATPDPNARAARELPAGRHDIEFSTSEPTLVVIVDRRDGAGR
jgi:hypothetical protein